MEYSKRLKQKLKDNKVLVVAHQGFASGNVVLNSSHAMLCAVNNGADMVELDVSRTSDGVYYVFHEELEQRHLLTTKRISEFTSSQLDEMTLYNNAFIKTDFRISTLDEMMSILKGKDTLINVDKCDQFDAELLDKLSEYGMEEQLILKGTCNKEFLDMVNTHKTNFMFMPVVSTVEDVELALSYNNINIVGFELLFEKVTDKIVSDNVINDLKSKGYFLWVNAITLGKGYCLSADIDDDLSMLDDPDKGWGRLIDMGFNVIQTDWTPILKKYISERIS